MMEEKQSFDRKLAQECAQAFWGSTGLGCVISDQSGLVLREYGYGCQSCRLCGVLGKDKENCVQAQLYGMTEAERFGGKYIYYCPMGLTCFVSPILGEVKSEAKITVGPFLMVERQDYIDCELGGFEGILPGKAEAVSAVLQKIPNVSPQRVQQLSTLLFMSVGFLNNVWAASQLQSQQEAGIIQGQISDYIYHLKNSEAKAYPIDQEKALLRSIARGQREKARRLLNELLGHILFSCGADFVQVKARLDELLVLMGRAAMDSGADMQGILRGASRRRQVLAALEDVETLCFWLARQMNAMMDSVFRFADVRHASTIHRCMQYIEEHYNEKITLAQMAQMVYLSPAYLSRVFTQETGEAFNTYLNTVRVQKSKALLRHEELRLADIAGAVGFEDQSYFTKVFKRVVGITPNQYRNTLKQKAER